MPLAEEWVDAGSAVGERCFEVRVATECARDIGRRLVTARPRADHFWAGDVPGPGVGVLPPVTPQLVLRDEIAIAEKVQKGERIACAQGKTHGTAETNVTDSNGYEAIRPLIRTLRGQRRSFGAVARRPLAACCGAITSEKGALGGEWRS